MAADQTTQQAKTGHRFGSCCETLREAMSGTEFDPLVTMGDDDVLYVSVGLIDVEEEEPGMVEYPVMFCPFCGVRLQTTEEVDQKSAASAGT